SITWDPASVQLSRIAQTLNSLGYPPHPARDASARRARSREDRQWIIRIGVAGALAGNVMLIAIALYAGLFGGMEAAHTAFFRILSLALGVISLAWPGAVFFRSAWGALRAKTLSLDVPIAVGLAAGGVSGFINTIRGSGEIYFDSLTALVFLLLVGRWIQRRQQRRAADSVALLYSLTPTSATRLDPETGARSEVSIESLQTGDIVEVIAGASIPADGFVTEGASTVDQSILTGESRPIEVQTGDRVAAGAVNLAAPIRMVVEATGAETRVGGMMRLVEEGARRRAPIVQAADRLAGRFVAAVLIIASLTVVVWLFIDPSRAIEHAVSLLIVTCPCALALATPLAIAVAIGRAARRGILSKGGDALERLATPGTILLDKTGTITRGSAALAHWSGDDDIRPLVAALEATSNHPVAKALVNGLGGAPHLEVVHAH
ncbi:MAG: HAD-IC family P-type ATPase, partial [Planctomycetota bacterium]|nr:HAD-IC family P-type ATPase [Planctomycetota bacterium]